MTATATETPVTESTTESVEVPAEVETPELALDEFGELARTRLKGAITELNAVNLQIKSAQGTPEELDKALEQTYTDNGGPYDVLSEKATKLDKALDQVVTEMRSLRAAKVAEMQSDATANVQPLLDKQATLTKTVKSGKDYLVGLYGEESIAKLPDVVKSRKSSGSAASGTGGKRIRGFDFYVNGQLAELADGQGNKKSSSSAVAKVIKADTKVCQEAFWSAQGTQNAADFKDEVSYSMTVGDTTYEIVARKQAADDSAE